MYRQVWTATCTCRQHNINTNSNTLLLLLAHLSHLLKQGRLLLVATAGINDDEVTAILAKQVNARARDDGRVTLQV